MPPRSIEVLTVFFSPSLFTDFHLPLICMRVAKCMIYVEPEWKIMTLLIDKKRIAGMKMAFQSFFCFSFTPTFISLHSFVHLLSPPCFSHVVAILVLFHLCQIGYFAQCVPPPPLHWHHCWRRVISRSNNRQLLCYSVELISLLCRLPTVHDGAFSARWHHLSGHSACL